MKMKFLSLIFFVFVLCLDAFSCDNARNRINKFFEARGAAFSQAKRDAKVPRNQHPEKVEHVPMTDRNNNPLFDENHQMIMTREYHYTTTEGKKIVIQEHTAAHAGATRAAGGMAHFNVRPVDDLRTGRVPGTAAHYNIGPEDVP